MAQVLPPLQLSLPHVAFRSHTSAACTLEPWSIGCHQPDGCLQAGEFGSGFVRVCCRMLWQPKAGFVQGALDLMLSRHMLFPARQPPALCKLPFFFVFFFLLFHFITMLRMLFIPLTPSCSLDSADGKVTQPPCVFRSGFPAWMCCHISCRELQSR